MIESILRFDVRNKDIPHLAEHIPMDRLAQFDVEDADIVRIVLVRFKLISTA